MSDISGWEDMRSKARECFEVLGWPTHRLEAWRYTDLARFLSKNKICESEKKNDNTPNVFEKISPIQFIFIDGILQKLPDISGCIIKKISFDGTSTDGTSTDGTSLKFDEDDQNDALLAANLGYFRDGVVIEVMDKIDRPIELIWQGRMQNKAIHGRVELTLREGAELTLIETYCGVGVTHIVNEMTLHADSSLTYIKIHAADVTQMATVLTRVYLSSKAYIKTIGCYLTAALGRHEMRINLQDCEAQSDMFIALLGEGKQHMDVTTYLNHISARTKSQTMIRSVLDGHSCGVFQGKITVCPDAQKVEASLKTDALMLSQMSEMNVKPELEIYADDVVCTHGSSIGEMDKDILFYLQSRGVDEGEARILLMRGFLVDILDGLENDAIRACLETYLDARLQAFAWDKVE